MLGQVGTIGAWRVDKEEFKKRQASLGWTNTKMAAHLRKTSQSVSNYRTGRQKIPDHVDVLLDAALKLLRDRPVGVSPVVTPTDS